MARNRKRAKERRARRPQPVAAARGKREAEAPDPMSHAAPDVELAEAQMAVGRSEFTELDSQPEAEPEAGLDSQPEADLDSQPAAGTELEDADELEAPEELDGERGGEIVVPTAAAAERRAVPGNRLVNFLQGSWRELQRVQWPDRRQVIQATGVVIGFVIVAGVFLGVADFLAGKLMNFVLK